MQNSSNSNNYNYFHFLSPLHQRFSEIENRLKLRLKNFAFSNVLFDGACDINIESIDKNNFTTQCYTAPLPRKNLKTMGDRSRLCFDPNNPAFSKRKSPTAEIDSWFDSIKDKSGTLDFGIITYSRVKPNDLTEITEIGEGTCGCVTHCCYNGSSMAVKRMKRTDNVTEVKRIFMDLDVITRCHSPYIIRCIGYMITFNEIYICMETMATCFDKLLHKLKVGLPETIVAKVALNVIKALDYLKEEHKIMHRDIKPSNILLDWSGKIKLCDFGISGKLVDSKAFTKGIGCAGYLAPERIHSSELNGYDVRSDVWSLGITLIQLIKGHFPYKSLNAFDVMLEIYQKPSPMIKKNEPFSDECRKFVNSCIEKNFESRPKYKQLLKEEFVKKNVASDQQVGEWFRTIYK